MLIIFGLRTGVRPLGVVTVTCPQCGNPVAHRLEERRRTLTIFFVPLIPLGRTTVLTCTYCALTSDVEPDEVPGLLAQAHDPQIPRRPRGSGRSGMLPDGSHPDRP